MGTNIRPEVSKRNKYWIERHRYYELKHFCLQYPIWKEAYLALDGLLERGVDLTSFSKTNLHNNPTAKHAEALIFYSDRLHMIERTAKWTDESLAEYILLGVTKGKSYDNLRTVHNIPCSKDVYYEMYRRFFWLLNKERD